MVHFQIASITAIVLAGVFLLLGYEFYSEHKSSEIFKYIGIFLIALAVLFFIAVIYINSVSQNNLIDSMTSFRKSRAANPQIVKGLSKNHAAQHATP